MPTELENALKDIQNVYRDDVRLMPDSLGLVMDAARRTDKIYDLLRSLSADMHQGSTRPCKTCRDLTEKLGWPFGCYERQEMLKRRQEASDG